MCRAITDRSRASLSSILAVIGALMLSLIGPAGLPSPAHAATPGQHWYVAQSGAANFGSGTSCAAPDAVGTDDTAIRTVLNAATFDDTITICDGVYDITQTLIVDDSITIQGESTSGSILDGGSAVQIMRLNDDDSTAGDPLEVRVLVTDLTFRNGNTGPNGFEACNTKSQCGGAIYVENQSDLTVLRSYFVDNYANFFGGAIANQGGAGDVGGNIRIEQSTFQGNESELDAGAVGVLFNRASTHLINNTFIENKAITRDGGAVNINGSANAVIAANTFVDDRARNEGQSIRANSDNVTMQGNLFAPGSPISPGNRDDACWLRVSVSDDSSVATTGGCQTAQIVTRDSLNLRGLGNWGGPTPTVWIGPGSSAENANAGTCQLFDQRGATRTAAPCDAGAYERQGPTDEGTTGTLAYPGSLLADDTAAPTSSPTPSPLVVGRTIGYMSLSTGVCSVSTADGEVTPTAEGTCEVQWYLAPTLAADGAAADDSLTITKATQAPLTIQAPASLAVGATATLTTTGGSTGQTVVFSASPAGVCTVAGAQLNMVGSGTCTVGATMPGDSTYLPVNATDVSVTASSSSPPDPALPATPPVSVAAQVSGTSVAVTWQEPTSQGDFAISHYQVLSQPSGGWCLVAAPALTCPIHGLAAEGTYDFRVRALTGAGWSSWSQPSNPVTFPGGLEPTILITGSREGRRIKVAGSVTGLSADAVLRPWVRMARQTEFTQGRAQIVVDESGEFTWSRRAGRVVEVYVAARVTASPGDVTSNVVPIRSRAGQGR